MKSLDKGVGVIYLRKGGDKMPANQKYSARIHSRRQLGRASEHIQATSKVLSEVGLRYKEALPGVSLACSQMFEMLSMVDSMINDIKENI